MIHFITLCDSSSFDKNKHNLFQKSFDKYNISNISIHYIHSYNPNIKNYNKITEILSYLRSNQSSTNADDIIIYLDSFDTLFMKNIDIQDIENTFLSKNIDLLFGSSQEFYNMFPESKPYYDNKYNNTKFKYLSTHFFIDFRKSIIQLFHFISSKLQYYPNPDKSFQDKRIIGMIFSHIYNQNYSQYRALENIKIDIDYSCTFSFNKLPNTSLNEIILKKPYFVHFQKIKNNIKQQSDYFVISSLKDLL